MNWINCEFKFFAFKTNSNKNKAERTKYSKVPETFLKQSVNIVLPLAILSVLFLWPWHQLLFLKVGDDQMIEQLYGFESDAGEMGYFSRGKGSKGRNSPCATA